MNTKKEDIRNRIFGCIIGMLCGDSIGAQVEFKSSSYIYNYFYDNKAKKPILSMKDGGSWDLIQGQITDDSEMALSLGYTINENGYDKNMARLAYKEWINSKPFDVGNTIKSALKYNKYSFTSQANGALMRVSPLAAYLWKSSDDIIAKHATEDCSITHVHKNCISCNILYCLLIAKLISGMDIHDAYEYIKKYAFYSNNISEDVKSWLSELENEYKYIDFSENQGWVKLTFQNALYQILNADSIYEGIYNTIMNGGDTDTNASISGSLLGAYYGLSNIPEEWIDILMHCKPDKNDYRVNHPRPTKYWPKNGFDIANNICKLTNLPELF